MVTRSEVKTPFGPKTNYFVKGEWIYSEYSAPVEQASSGATAKTSEATDSPSGWFGLFRRKRNLAVS